MIIVVLFTSVVTDFVPFVAVVQIKFPLPDITRCFVLNLHNFRYTSTMSAKKKAVPQEAVSDDSGSDSSEEEDIIEEDRDIPVSESDSEEEEDEPVGKKNKKKSDSEYSSRSPYHHITHSFLSTEPSTEDKPVRPNEEKKTIFIGNLPINTKIDQLKKAFEKFGAIKTVRLRSHTGKKIFSKSMVKKDAFITAFILYEQEAMAEAAVEKHDKIFKDRRIRVTLAGQKKGTNKKTIFVGNLPYATVDDDLYEVFSTCGEVESIRTIRGPNGCTGIAYVSFKEKSSLILALQLQGTMIRDRPVRLEKCKDIEKAENKKNAKEQQHKSKIVHKFVNGKHIKEKIPVTNADNALKRLKKKPGFSEDNKRGGGPRAGAPRFGKPGQRNDQGQGSSKGGAKRDNFKPSATKKKGMPKSIQMAKRLNVNWKKPTYKAPPKKTNHGK